VKTQTTTTTVTLLPRKRNCRTGEPKIVQDLSLLLEIDLVLGRKKGFQARLRDAIDALSQEGWHQKARQ